LGLDYAISGATWVILRFGKLSLFLETRETADVIDVVDVVIVISIVNIVVGGGDDGSRKNCQKLPINKSDLNEEKT